MPYVLTIREERAGPTGEDIVFDLEVPEERLTVRELIREHVYQLVDDYNHLIRAGEAPRIRGWISPPEHNQEVDWRPCFEQALRAYENRGVLVLVGDRQTESLDEVIRVAPGVEVTFLRLVMLAGG